MTDSKILCVEDDSINRFVIKTILKDVYEITLVEKPDEALKQLKSSSFELVLIDINLGKGEINGVELMQEIRATIKPCPVVIAMTAYALHGDKERFLEAGFDHYLSKPVDRDEIIKIIEQVLASTTKKT